MAASVPAVDEFVEVAAQMRRAEPMVGAERPCLEISKDPVDPRQDDVGGH